LVTDASSFLQSLTTPSLKINLVINQEFFSGRIYQEFLPKQIEKKKQTKGFSRFSSGDTSFEEVSLC